MSSIVFFLILTTITFAGHVHSKSIYTPKTLVAEGSNVTIYSDTVVTLGLWLFNNDVIMIFYPGGQAISNAYKDRVTYDSTISALTITSAALNYSGVYTLKIINDFTAQLTITVEELITNATLSAQKTNLVEFNDTAVLTCAVSTGSPLSNIWLNGNNSTIVNGGNAQLSNKNMTLTISTITRYNQGPYRCNVSNDLGYNVSSPLQLNINYGPDHPIITVTPVGSIFRTGSNILLSCSANSNPSAMIQWMFNDVSLNQYGPQLNLVNTNTSYSGTYTCICYNPVTLRYSSANSTIQIMDPIIAVVKPAGGPAILHQPFSLTCDVTGPVYSILWWKDGQLISADNTNVFATTNKTLTLTSAQLSDNSPYMCQAFNVVSNMTSSPYAVQINYGPDMVNITGSNVVKAGDNAILSCHGDSVPSSHYQWYFKGSLVSNMSQYITPPLTRDLSGNYICMASNTLFNKSSTAFIMLTVVDPIVNVQIEAQTNTAIESGLYELICNATGTVDFIYWMKNGQPLQADNRTIFSMDNKTVMFNPVERSDTGPYQCMAINAFENMTSIQYWLLVNYGPDMPTIVAPKAVLKGNNAILSCSADSVPSSVFSWYINGSLASNMSEYITPPLSKDMNWWFMCMAFNNITGKSNTTSIQLTIIDPIENVQVEAQMNSSIEGGSFELTCNTTGPVDFIYWMKNGQPLQADNRTVFSMDNRTVMFMPVNRSDAGNYQCMAINAVENVTSSPYYLIVNFGPATPIISGPAYGETGSQVVFSCNASSVPPSSFSWWFNGSMISNISILNVGPLALNMSGNYTCMAYNPVTGKNSTNSKMLRIIETIKSVMIINNTMPINNTNFTLICNVSGPYDAIYWMKDNVSLSWNASRTNPSMYGFKNNMLYFTPVTTGNNGTYQCVAINRGIRHKSSNYTLVVNYGPLNVYIAGPTGSGNVSLTCTADSYPDCVFRWFLNNKPAPVGTGSVFTFSAGKQNAGNYICQATNPVTNITVSQNKTYSVAGHASATLFVSKGGLMFVGLCALSAHLLFL